MEPLLSHPCVLGKTSPAFCWVTQFYANSPQGLQRQNAQWGRMLRTLPNFHADPHSIWLIKCEWYLDIDLVRNLNSLNIKLGCIYVSHVAVFWCIPMFHIPTIFSEDSITTEEIFYRILGYLHALCNHSVSDLLTQITSLLKSRSLLKWLLPQSMLTFAL